MSATARPHRLRNRLQRLSALLTSRLLYVSIRFKILLLPAFAILTFAVYSLIVSLASRDTTRTLDHFETSQLPAMALISQANLGLSETQSLYTQAIGDHDEFLLEDAQSRAFETRAKIAMIATKDPQSAALVAEVLALWDQYASKSATAVSGTLTGEADFISLQTLSTEKQQAYDAVRAALAKLQADSEHTFGAALDTAAQRSARSLKLGAAIVAALSVLSLLVAVIVDGAISQPIGQLNAAIAQVVRGNFATGVQVRGSDAVATMCAAFNSLLAYLRAAISETNSVLAAVGHGDFSKRVTASLPGELGRLKDGVNTTADSLQRTMAELAERELNLERRVEARTHELARSEERFRTLAVGAPIGIFLADAEGHALYTNPRWQEIAGLSRDDAVGGGWQQAVHPDDAERVIKQSLDCARRGEPFESEFRFRHTDGEVRDVRVRTRAVRDDSGRVIAHVGSAEDLTEQKRVAAELQQAQKLESVGRLAAGVAHEINTPVQFVNDSCYFLRDALGDLAGVITKYRETLAAVADGSLDAATAADRLRAVDEQADLAYLLENMPSAVEQSLEGLARVATIVRSMKEFAHPDQKEKAYADLNRAIESTLTIARNEYKYVADVVTEFGELPPVCCYLSDFNQAVLNIVVNAAHVIGDKIAGTDERGRITVRTRRDGDDAVVEIEDTGGGIPESIRDKIFDPFFTTKEVGKGTGQGLAITRSVIVDKHRGSIAIDSVDGHGTTFILRLPIESDIGCTEAA